MGHYRGAWGGYGGLYGYGNDLYDGYGFGCPYTTWVRTVHGLRQVCT
jgi:hypothetical protein